MAESMVDIKRRIKSVSSTKQITKAMELVASAKLRKAKDMALKRSEYTKTMLSMIEKFSNYTNNLDSIYFKENSKNKNKLFIVIAGDRGLAGGYNSSIFKKAESLIEDKDNSKIIAVGSKARDFFTKKGYDVAFEYTNIGENPEYDDASQIGKNIISLYDNNVASEVYLIYSKFNSVISQSPTCAKLLPIVKGDIIKQEEKGMKSMIFEPSEEKVFDYLIPKYIMDIIYGAMIDNFAGEQSSRRMAMSSASDNASEIIEDLSIKYNTARQASITQEITEIVSGANASK